MSTCRNDGALFKKKLIALNAAEIIEVRGLGLMCGVVLKPEWDAHVFCTELLARGILSKDTHGNVVRLSPPLVINEEEIDMAIAAIEDVLVTGRRVAKERSDLSVHLI